MLSVSGAMLDALLTYGAQPLGFAQLQPFAAYQWQACVQPGDCHQPTLEVH